jgi:VWFA-related protein
MTFHRIAFTLFIALLSGTPASPAQQPQSATPPTSHDIRLDVFVDTKAGQPVTKLTQQNFTVLDNKTPRPITSFKVMTPADEPVSVIVLVDAVNSPFQLVTRSRDGIDKFLKENEGQLAYPTAVAVLTDQGIEMGNSFFTDGNALSDAFDHHAIGLRQITRESQWSGPERLQISMNAFQQLIGFTSSLHGRKIVLWISPGWPFESGPGIQLSLRQEQQFFNQIVDISTRLRQIDLTLYNINPIGVGESLERANYYESFLKGVSKLNQVQLGNFGLQVLAVHSGGLALESNSDITGMMQTCLTDAQSWYRIAFDPLPSDKPNEYHHVEIKVDQPGFVVRTRDGYYANPVAITPR